MKPIMNNIYIYTYSYIVVKMVAEYVPMNKLGLPIVKLGNMTSAFKIANLEALICLDVL